MQYDTGILWFRNDLRLHDHEALSKALEQCEKVVPVYCLDPRQFEETPFGFPKTGMFRAKFLSESLQTLATKLKEKNSGLLIQVGKPEEILPAIAEEYQAKAVFYHKEIAHEETSVEKSLDTNSIRLFKHALRRYTHD